MGGFRDLLVWRKGMALAEAVYRAARALPAEERLALGDQLRRAAVSVPSNIAEGYARHSRAEFRHFLRVASGSCAEVWTQLCLAVRVGLLSQAQVAEALDLADEVGRMLYALALRTEEGRVVREEDVWCDD